MSMDRSLKMKGALERHRNVLSRAERVVQLAEQERWQEGDDVTGLPKLGHRKSHSGKKGGDEKKEQDDAAATEEDTTEAPAT